VRRLRGSPQLDVRVRARAPLAGAEIGSGARFERVSLEIDGALHRTVLKVTAPDPICVGREQRFCEELAPTLPARVPAVFGTGAVEGQDDGWVLLEFPKPLRWRPRAFAALREIAHVHRRRWNAHRVGRARPGTRPAAAHVPRARAPEALQARERWCAISRRRRGALARRPLRALDARRPFAGSRSAWCNRPAPGQRPAAARRPADPADWESVCAGPPIFDDPARPVSQFASPHPAAQGRGGLLGRRRAALVGARARVHGQRRRRPRAAVASAANGAFAWDSTGSAGAPRSSTAALPRTRPLRRLPLVGVRA
jgi:hypothetical protein